MDPLASEMPSWSPYNYVLNNPIRLVDPTGMRPEEPDDWYEGAEGNILFNEDIKSQADLEVAGIEGTYLGETFIDFSGSTNESLGADGTLTGEGAKPAEVTVYGPGGADDIQSYAGLSVSSDPSKYSMIEEGFYSAEYSPMATSLYGDNARTESKGIPGALTYRLSKNGSTDLTPVGGININKNSKNYGTGVINGIFLHRTNWSGRATNSSQGCLNICGTQWRRFEAQVGKSSNIRLRLRR